MLSLVIEFYKPSVNLDSDLVQVVGDERPFLWVNVLKVNLVELMDTGASCT